MTFCRIKVSGTLPDNYFC